MILWSFANCRALFGANLSRFHTSESVVFTEIYMKNKETYQPYMEYQYTTEVILFVISVTLHLYGSICELFSF